MREYLGDSDGNTIRIRKYTQTVYDSQAKESEIFDTQATKQNETKKNMRKMND